MRIICWLGVGFLMGGCVVGRGADAVVIPLPAPETSGGRPLMEVLGDRRSSREFSARSLTRQVLSDLLWAAFGVNRGETQGRTAPSAMNSREVEIYVSSEQGTYRFEPERHGLLPVSKEDVRALTGGQDYVTKAAVALIYVADLRRLARAPDAERAFYAAADTGFVGQNVYLFCASQGLASVVHVVGRKDALREALKLDPEQKIILAHAVGYPAVPGENP